MEESSTNNQQKIFTNRAISIATFFGGPLAAGILIAKNYKVFNNNAAARNSLFIGILTTVILFAGIFAIPEDIIDKIPQSPIPFIYTGIIALIVERSQGSKIKSFLENEGKKASGWSAAGYGFLGFLITGVFLTIFILSAPHAGYEKKKELGNNVALYYGKKMDEAKVDRVSLMLKQSGFLDGSAGADLFISNEAEKFKIKFVIPDTSVLSDIQFISDFRGFEKYLNYNLDFDPEVEFGFTDITLTKDFDLPKAEKFDEQFYEGLLYLQQYQISDNHNIFYNSTMPISDVKVVEDAVKRLKSYFPQNQNIDIIFLNTGEQYVLKFFTAKALWSNPGTIEWLKSISEYFQDSGIGKKLQLKLIDPTDYSEKQIL